MRLILGLLIALGFVGCASQSVLPVTKEVKVSRETPKDCKELGKVTGQTIFAKGTPEDALEDMKKSAAEKAATHVVVEQYSANRTSVTGLAYQCP